MAHIFANMIGEYSTTPGTGVLDLDGGAIFGHRVFDDVMASADTCFIRTKMGADFEVALATFSAGTPDQITRTTILDSTNGGAAVSWGAGTKEIVLVHPAEALRGRKSADIAAAATLVLNNVAGDVVDVTGNTGITAITLTEGREVKTRFTGIPTITHGASLVLLGETNITAAVGDFAVWLGYAAGVVRCVEYRRSDGTAFQARLTADAVNATGDGTTVTLIPTTETFDYGSNYNNATGVYTAPYGAPYSFGGNVFLDGLAADTHRIIMEVTTSNRAYYVLDVTVNGASELHAWCLPAVDMDAGDTFSITVRGLNGAKTIDFLSNATAGYTTLMGHAVL